MAKSPKEVLRIAEAHAGDFNEIHCATCLYQLAKLRQALRKEDAQSQMLLDLVEFLGYETRLMMPRALANTAWSIAQLEPLMGKRVLKLMPSIVEQSLSTIDKFNARDLSNLALALATLKDKNLPLLAGIGTVARRRMREGNAQDLSNLVWGFATLGFKDEPLMDAVASRAVAIIDEFVPQGLANLAWGFATFGIRSQPLMDAIEARALSMLHRLKAQDLGNLASSYWRLGLKKQHLLSRVCDAMCKLSLGAQADESVVMAWTVIMPAAASMGTVDKATRSVCSQSLLSPGALRKANDYSIAALMRSAQLDGWEAKEQELFRSLARECEIRRIGQVAIDSKLLAEPANWVVEYR